MKCKVEKLCGGCQLLKVGREEQAKRKREAVEDIMEKAHLDVKVAPVWMAENDLYYRNKVIVGFAKDKSRKVFSGLYAAHSHRVVNTSGCMMQPLIVNQIIDEITSLVDSMKIELYNEKTGTGLLRHVMVRYAHSTNEVMVVFVTSSKMFPSRRNIVNALVKKFPQIATIVQNINPRRTSIVMQDESIVLYGKGYITDILCGLKISFTASSFYQIHSEQCDVLYRLAADMLALRVQDKVLDTYCGVGTIGLTLASKCREVTGVEVNADAVEMARHNAAQNGIRNARFVAMDSTQFMKQARKFHQKYEAIILDPPRAGTTKMFIESACALQPNRILYISCDPRTQARDLIYFKRFGYYTDEICPVDMFPNTEHIETVALLTKRKMRSNKTPFAQKKTDKPHGPGKGGFRGAKTGLQKRRGTAGRKTGRSKRR